MASSGQNKGGKQDPSYLKYLGIPGLAGDDLEEFLINLETGGGGGTQSMNGKTIEIMLRGTPGQFVGTDDPANIAITLPEGFQMFAYDNDTYGILYDGHSVNGVPAIPTVAAIQPDIHDVFMANYHYDGNTGTILGAGILAVSFDGIVAHARVTVLQGINQNITSSSYLYPNTTFSIDASDATDIITLEISGGEPAAPSQHEEITVQRIDNDPTKIVQFTGATIDGVTQQSLLPLETLRLTKVLDGSWRSIKGARPTEAAVILALPSLTPDPEDVVYWVNYTPGSTGDASGFNNYTTAQSYTWTDQVGYAPNINVLVLLPGDTWPSKLCRITPGDPAKLTEIPVFGNTPVSLGCGGAAQGVSSSWTAWNWGTWWGSPDPYTPALFFTPTGMNAEQVWVTATEQTLAQWISEHPNTFPLNLVVDWVILEDVNNDLTTPAIDWEQVLIDYSIKDQITPASGKVLINNQIDSTRNGIYQVNASNEAWTKLYEVPETGTVTVDYSGSSVSRGNQYVSKVSTNSYIESLNIRNTAATFTFDFDGDGTTTTFIGNNATVDLLVANLQVIEKASGYRVPESSYTCTGFDSIILNFNLPPTNGVGYRCIVTGQRLMPIQPLHCQGPHLRPVAFQ